MPSSAATWLKPPSLTPGSPVAWQAMRARGVTRAERAAAIGRARQPARHDRGHRAARRGRLDVCVAAGAAAVERRRVVTCGAQRQRASVAVREPPVAGHVRQQAGGAGRGVERRGAARGACQDMPAIAAEVDTHAHGRVGQAARTTRRRDARLGAQATAVVARPRRLDRDVAARARRHRHDAPRRRRARRFGNRRHARAEGLAVGLRGGVSQRRARQLPPVDAAAGDVTRERGAHGKRRAESHRAGGRFQPQAVACVRGGGRGRQPIDVASRKPAPVTASARPSITRPPSGSCRTGSDRTRNRSAARTTGPVCRGCSGCRRNGCRPRRAGPRRMGQRAFAREHRDRTRAAADRRTASGIASRPCRRRGNRARSRRRHVRGGVDPRRCRRTIPDRRLPARHPPPALRPRRRSRRRCPCTAIRRRRACAGGVARSWRRCRRRRRRSARVPRSVAPRRRRHSATP